MSGMSNIKMHTSTSSILGISILFCKESFLGTVRPIHLHTVYATFTLQWHSLKVRTETVWLTKFGTFPVDSLREHLLILNNCDR